MLTAQRQHAWYPYATPANLSAETGKKPLSGWWLVPVVGVMVGLIGFTIVAGSGLYTR